MKQISEATQQREWPCLPCHATVCRRNDATQGYAILHAERLEEKLNLYWHFNDSRPEVFLPH